MSSLPVKMTSLFTVKLDLSCMPHEKEQQRLFIVMVDPSKMNMIYEFKLWIRFLFSINSSVQLVYDDATLHDFDDIRILSLLKTVKVQPAGHAYEEEKEQEQLLAKLRDYNKWCENMKYRLSNGLKNMNGDNIQLPVSTNLMLTSSKLNSGNAVNGGKEITCTYTRNRESNTQLMLAQRYPESIVWENGGEFSLESPVRCHKDGPQEINMNRLSESKKNSSDALPCKDPPAIDYTNELDPTINQNVKSDECLNRRDSLRNTESEALTFKNGANMTNGLKIPSKLNNKKNNTGISTCTKRNLNKPFSVGNFLDMIRNSNSDVEGKKMNIVLTESSTESKINENEEEQQSDSSRKKRKRIRKHKSKKNSSGNISHDSSLASNTLQQSYYTEDESGVSPSVKPKHIRFNSDEEYASDLEESDQPGKRKSADQVSFPEVKGEEFHQLIQSMLKERRKQLAESTPNSAQPVTIDNPPESSSCSKLSVKENSTVGDNTVSENTPEGVLQIFSNFQKQNSSPMVFDRFQ